MTVLVSMLRGVNIGPHNRIKMDELRAMYKVLNLEDARTYVQSGNIIFRTREKNGPQLAKRIQEAIQQKFGCSPEVVLRTREELQKAIDANPFPEHTKVEPGKVLVTFLAADPPRGVAASLDKFRDFPEKLHLHGCELYIYFPNGAGRSKLPWSSIDKLLRVTGTARNWNSIQAILKIAEEMEAH